MGQDPLQYLRIALENLVITRKLGGSFLEEEQTAALAHLTVAREELRHAQDPGPALAEVQEDLNRCFAITPQDATCRTLAAKAAWVQSDWRISRGQQGTSILEGALAKAVLATQSPEANPDAWQTLAETYLRLARVEQNHPQVRDAYLEKGLSAAQKIYEINPNHALGRATEGALRLLVAQSAPCWPTCTCPMRLMRGCKGTYPSIPFERLVDDGLVVTSAGAEIRSYVHI